MSNTTLAGGFHAPPPMPSDSVSRSRKSQLWNCVLLIFVGFALYRLFQDVDRRLAAVTAVLMWISVPIQLLNLVFAIAPLMLTTGQAYLQPFSKAQIDTLAYLFYRLHASGLMVADDRQAARESEGNGESVQIDDNQVARQRQLRKRTDQAITELDGCDTEPNPVQNFILVGGDGPDADPRRDVVKPIHELREVPPSLTHLDFAQRKAHFAGECLFCSRCLAGIGEHEN